MGGAPYKSARDGGGHSSVRLWYQQKHTSCHCLCCSDETIQRHASMVTTEISQVPLSGVLQLLQSARWALS